MLKKLLSHALAFLLGLLIASSHFIPNWNEIGVSINNLVTSAIENPWGKSTEESVDVQLSQVNKVTATVFATRQVIVSRRYDSTYLKVFNSTETHTAAVTFYFCYAQSDGLSSLASNEGALDSVPLTQTIEGKKIVITYKKESFLAPYSIEGIQTQNEELTSFWSTLTNPAAIYDNACFSNTRTQALVKEDIPDVARLLARSIEEEYISQLSELPEASNIEVNGHPVLQWEDSFYVWNEESLPSLSHEGEEDAPVSVTYDEQGYKDFLSSLTEKES